MTAGNFTFPKASRLKLARDFRSILKAGKPFKQGGVVLYLQKNDLKTSRIGIIISKKFLKSAVDRNLIKRWVREFYRKQQNRFTDHFDVIVRFVMNHNLLEYSNLEKNLTELFKKSRLIY